MNFRVTRLAVISLKVALFGLFYRTTLVSCKIWSGSTESYTENMEGNDWATQLKWSMGGVKKVNHYHVSRWRAQRLDYQKPKGRVSYNGEFFVTLRFFCRRAAFVLWHVEYRVDQIWLALCKYASSTKSKINKKVSFLWFCKTSSTTGKIYWVYFHTKS